MILYNTEQVGKQRQLFRPSCLSSENQHLSLCNGYLHSQNTDPESRWEQKFLDFCFYIILMNLTVQKNNEKT